MSYQVSAKGVLLTEQFEGFIPHPYQKPGDVPTIGYGTTFYPDGTKVTLKDPWCTRDQAAVWLLNFMNTLSIPVITHYVNVTLNQNQVDALADFIYNDGTEAFETSHLLMAINSNAGRAAITAEFMKWVYVDHVKSAWQIKRRTAEANLYFS
jgi:lysozyme